MQTTETRRNVHPAPVALAPGDLVLERYRLDSRLGAGGFGVVWRAHDERLRRAVAVKVVPHAAGPARVRREALAAARLNHPGIVTLYESGADDHAAYLVSELVEGATLAELERDGALSDRDVAAIGVTLCDALAHAHAHGVVHRDVKPQNVIVPERPRNGAIAKLTDFGIAQLAGADPITRTHDVVGTRAYMAPEQAAGRGADERADVYALGVVLYEALAGAHPAELEAGAAPLPLARVRRGLPRALAAAIDSAVATRPERRCSLAELRMGLASARGRLDDTLGPVAAPRLERVTRRRSAPGGEPDAGLGAATDAGAVEPAGRSAPQRSTRLLAGLSAAAVVFAGATLAPLRPPAAVLAACAGALCALVPRLGWLVTVAAGVGVCALGAPPLGPGVALALAAAALPAPFLLARAPALWWLPVAAPALGLAGAAGAFPALAAVARTAPRRAALGALGYWWIVLAELVVHRPLLFGPPRAAAAADAWQGSPTAAVAHALAPLVRSGSLAGALLWAVAAVALPWLVRGSSLAAVASGCVAWAASLAAATLALGDAVRDRLVFGGAPHGVLLGAVAGAVVALACRLLAARRAVVA